MSIRLAMEVQINQELIQRRLNRFSGFRNGPQMFSARVRKEFDEKIRYEKRESARHNEFFRKLRLEKKEKKRTASIPTSSLVFLPSKVTRRPVLTNLAQRPIAVEQSADSEPVKKVQSVKKVRKVKPCDLQRQMRYVLKKVRENLVDVVCLGGRALIRKRFAKLPDEIDALKSHQRRIEQSLNNISASVSQMNTIKSAFISKSQFDQFKTDLDYNLERIRQGASSFDQIVQRPDDQRNFLRTHDPPVVRKVGYVNENEKIRHSNGCSNVSRRYYSSECQEKKCKIFPK